MVPGIGKNHQVPYDVISSFHHWICLTSSDMYEEFTEDNIYTK